MKAEYEQVLITTTDLEQVNRFFGSKANYFYVSNGQVWPSDQFGDVGDSGRFRKLNVPLLACKQCGGVSHGIAESPVLDSNGSTRSGTACKQAVAPED